MLVSCGWDCLVLPDLEKDECRNKDNDDGDSGGNDYRQKAGIACAFFGAWVTV